MRVIKITVRPEQDRLDKFLAQKVKSLSRSQAKRLIKTGFILVNNQQVDPDYKIDRGDVIKIEIPPPKPTQVLPEPLPLKIVYEDPDLLLIDKEAGVVTHPTLDHPGGTLVNAFLFHLKKVPEMGESLRPGIVHRLDRGTSGLLVVAKTKEALESLKGQFKSRGVVKKYLVLVSRLPQVSVGRIDKPIGRHPANRKKFTVASSGREAVTEYKVLESYGDSYSLIEAEPKTGRTHQIRVHLASIGHPIVGDKLYGGKAAPRMFLHAAYLEFTHPKSGKRLSFSSELPSELVAILDKIKEGSYK
jgi:23S rRNA pseudouridine1911/1915/1917 synthase